ncbi:MAG: NYN domain-containing protein [Candidatus Nitrospinota bacterium M3_3B_026]
MADRKGRDQYMTNLVYQKVGVFIDAENVELSGYNIFGGRTNYALLIEEIGRREITRIIYYKPIHKTISDDFRRFWTSMGGEIKQPIKNADAWLAIDAVTLADKLDVVVLVGGDKDYLPLVWYLKNRGCKVEIWSYPETCSDMMQEAADLFVPLDGRFTIQDRPGGRVRQLKKT